MNKKKSKQPAKPTIGIIGGTGKMGQWLYSFFTARDIPVLIAGRKTQLTIKDLTEKSDIIIVSVPISETVPVIEEIKKHIHKDALLTDISSLKVIPMRAMEGVDSGTLSMHPLFGPTIGEAKGQRIIFCHQKKNHWYEFLQHHFETSGIEVIKMGAEEHDYHMAYIQALTHALNLLYAKILLEQSDALSRRVQTPLFMLQSLVMGRVLHQDLGLSAELQIYNPYFLPLLENLSAYSRELLAIIEKEDKAAFNKLFLESRQIGHEFANFSMLHTDKILKLVSDVHVSLPEKPVVRGLAERATIAYLGPEGTYSHLGTETVFKKQRHKHIPYDTIYAVFSSVLNGEATYGIVPAENSLEGTVKGTLDYLVEFSLVVVGSFALSIHHQLASIEKNLSSIETVISHPQALAQCERWLRKHLPTTKVIPSASTTADLKKPKKKTAYICSKLASKIYNLQILAKDIEDNKKNTTRFYFIAKKQDALSGLSNKKTLVFLTIYNRVGILRDILHVLAHNGLNLTKLESRPSFEKIWDYHFFVEIDTRYDSPSLKKALVELESYCPVIRILGQT